MQMRKKSNIYKIKKKNVHIVCGPIRMMKLIIIQQTITTCILFKNIKFETMLKNVSYILCRDCYV